MAFTRTLATRRLPGEDGRIAGNPDVDINLVNVQIDLGGLILLEPTTLTIVCLLPPLMMMMMMLVCDIHTDALDGIVAQSALWSRRC